MRRRGWETLAENLAENPCSAEQSKSAGQFGELSRKGRQETLLRNIFVIRVHREFAMDILFPKLLGKSKLGGSEAVIISGVILTVRERAYQSRVY